MSPEMAAFVRAWKRGLASHGGGKLATPKAGELKNLHFFSDIYPDKEIAHVKAAAPNFHSFLDFRPLSGVIYDSPPFPVSNCGHNKSSEADQLQ